MKLRFWMPLIACAALLLNACGGGGSSGNGSIRLVNATTEFPSLDFYQGTTLLGSAIAADAAGTYSSLGAGTYAFQLTSAGTTTTVASTSRAITKDVNNTLVAYKTNGLVTTAYLTDSEAAPTTGAAKLRVLNTSEEAGVVDVYVTSPDADLTTTSPTLAGVAGERASVYSEIGAGTYRVRVTGTGNSADIRLDLPAVTLTDQQIATLVLTTTPGGVLVNSLVLNQGAEATGFRNTSARVRLVAGAAASATVSATVGSAVLATNLRSPNLTVYSTVTAGALPTSIVVGGATLPASTVTLAPGTDTTLMVTGTATVSTIADNNQPSTNTTFPTRLRMINGVNGLNDVLTLSADYVPVANNVPAGTASIPANVANGTAVRLEVTAPSSLTPLFLATDAVLQPGRVYTLFMLGDYNPDPLLTQVQAALRADR